MFKVTIRVRSADLGLIHAEWKDTFIHSFQTEIEANAYILAFREIANFYRWEIEERIGVDYDMCGSRQAVPLSCSCGECTERKSGK